MRLNSATLWSATLNGGIVSRLVAAPATTIAAAAQVSAVATHTHDSYAQAIVGRASAYANCTLNQAAYSESSLQASANAFILNTVSAYAQNAGVAVFNALPGQSTAAQAESVASVSATATRIQTAEMACQVSAYVASDSVVTRMVGADIATPRAVMRVETRINGVQEGFASPQYAAALGAAALITVPTGVLFSIGPVMAASAVQKTHGTFGSTVISTFEPPVASVNMLGSAAGSGFAEVAAQLDYWIGGYATSTALAGLFLSPSQQHAGGAGAEYGAAFDAAMTTTFMPAASTVAEAVCEAMAERILMAEASPRSESCASVDATRQAQAKANSIASSDIAPPVAQVDPSIFAESEVDASSVVAAGLTLYSMADSFVEPSARMHAIGFSITDGGAGMVGRGSVIKPSARIGITHWSVAQPASAAGIHARGAVYGSAPAITERTMVQAAMPRRMETENNTRRMEIA